MAKQRGDGSGDQQYELKWVYLLVAIVLFCVLVWLKWGDAISSFLAVLRRYEMAVFAPFTNAANVLYEKLVVLDGRPLEFKQTAAMLTKTGVYVRWLFIPAIAVGGLWLYLKSNRTRFSTRHTMATLTKSQQEIWPCLAPIAGHQAELVAGDITKGVWAVNMTEWEFAQHHRLAKRGESLDKQAARDVFVRQLGPRWSGVNALPKHTKGMLGALLLWIVGERKAAEAAAELMATSYARGAAKLGDIDAGIASLDISFADEVIAKHMSHRLVIRVLERHAYVYTVMATMLQISRTGVVASALFTWLRPVDRRLWYTLNGVGRHTFCAESAGIHAHWLFEKAVGAACPTPMVQKAVDALEFALNEYTEDDSEERLFK